MIEFPLPSLGADMDEGRLLEWKVQPGEKVHRGQVIAVVDTAKAAVDVECWQEGEVFELLVEPGVKVPVGTPIATLLEAGETPATAQHRVKAAVAAPEPLASPVAPVMPLGSRPRISPAARKRAAELGIDAERLHGTGPHGVVTLDDVEGAGWPAAPVDRNAAMRQAIAAAMSRSKREIPHYYLAEALDLGPMLSWLQTYNAPLAPEARLLPAVLLFKAVALALREYPQLNGYWHDGSFQPASGVHLGVAVSLRQGGLVAPALHDVADKPVQALMDEFTDLVQRARSGSLRSSELSGAGLTVTLLGDQGTDSVFGVIYPPQVALVGFGRIVERPWVENGALCVRPVVNATLAADHRASDGHYGGRFLGEIRRLLLLPDQL
ncbi:dihydrolipoamide acetyltransferase family protein [Pseudomonas indica]|uniref:Dihydrolipoamide acetyltransferase component of pyruvate dehydrogenase complex n=1 Tax=Pseudomonas indica TaxID=137658 RepID=A0A1G9BWP3_9PSED|nr:dihydrolipoamide acetyltransferase family protein [Pseudomonas indica]SDK43810.1 pyruvate dehydrogenase E2 component (dihydrolipoamide acetyltransferase) [Pseudomonas indica]